MIPELEQPHTSLTYSILLCGLTLIASLVSFLIYKIVIYPLYRINFYRKQGSSCLYYPLIGHFGPAAKALKEHGDLKYLIKMESKTNPSKFMCTNLGFDAYFILHDPAMIKDFYLNTENYIKDPIFLEMYSGLLGKGLITSEGSKWKTQRKILSNAFHFEFFKSIFPIIKDTVHQNLYNLRKASLKNVNLLDAFQSITGQIIGKTFFGDQLNKHEFEGKPLTLGLDSLIGTVGKLSLSFERYLLGATIIQKGVFKRHRVLMQRIQAFRGICRVIIEERKEFYAKGGQSKSVKDMLDLLLEYNGEEGRMPEDEIIDQFISFFLAGMDTTGHVATIAEYYLQTYPEYRVRMLEEVQKHYNRDINIEELNKLEFTMAFIKEILRMTTPAPALIPRRVVKDHVIQDIQIKKGDLINIEYFYNHFNEEYFEDPETFNPDRWLNKQKNFDSYAFTPFSAGPRNCIGQHMALIETRVILAEYLLMYESQLKEGYKLKMSLRFLYEPLDMIEVNLTPKYE